MTPAVPDLFTGEGLVHGRAGRRRDLHISKNGSKHLRWVLVQAAWQLVRRSARWTTISETWKGRLRAKKAIVAVARRRPGLMLMLAVLQRGQPDDPAYVSAAGEHVERHRTLHAFPDPRVP